MEKNKTISLNVEDLFTPKKKELEDLALKYQWLRTQEIESKEQYEIVHKAEQELVKTRTWISKVRLEYTKPLELAKKEAIWKEKELLWVISPVEEDLKEQKSLYNNKQEKIKQDKLDEQRKVLQDRVEKLACVEFISNDLYELSQMEEKDFLELLNDKWELFEKIQEEKKAKERQDLINFNINDLMRAINIEEIENMKVAIIKSFWSFEEFQETYDNKRELLSMKEEKAKIEKDKQDLADQKKKIEDDKQKERDDKFKNRCDILQNLWLRFNWSEYCLNDFNVHHTEITCETDESFNKIVEDIKKEMERRAKEDKERIEKEAKEKAESDLKIENDRIKKEQEDILKKAEEKRKVEEWKLAKKKKYKEFLEKNWITNESLESWEIIKKTNEENKTISFYKKLDVFNY